MSDQANGLNQTQSHRGQPLEAFRIDQLDKCSPKYVEQVQNLRERFTQLTPEQRQQLLEQDPELRFLELSRDDLDRLLGGLCVQQKALDVMLQSVPKNF